jgi:hypothetical protein
MVQSARRSARLPPPAPRLRVSKGESDPLPHRAGKRADRPRSQRHRAQGRAQTRHGVARLPRRRRACQQPPRRPLRRRAAARRRGPCPREQSQPHPRRRTHRRARQPARSAGDGTLRQSRPRAQRRRPRRHPRPPHARCLRPHRGCRRRRDCTSSMFAATSGLPFSGRWPAGLPK